MADVLFNRVAFIGIGLIGSSLARVMRRDGLAKTIIACARTEETRKAALRLNLADSVTDDVAVADFAPASGKVIVADKRPEATPRAVRAPIVEHGAAAVQQLDLGVVAAYTSR